MKKLFSFLLLSFILTMISFAQDKISKGTSVKILEIAKSDSYYGERADFVGQDATTVSEIVKGKDGYYSGTLETGSGRTVYFTDVKISVKSSQGSSTVTVKTKTDAGAEFSGSSIPKGTRFKVLEVPSDDSYYSDRKDIEGQTGTTDAVLTLDNGYVGGSIKLDNGKSYYFYKVKLGKVSGSTTSASVSTSTAPKTNTTTPAKTIKFITGTIAAGTSVYVADISPDDSYYSDRYKYVGKKGKVKSAMTMKEDGYYAGDFTYDDGNTGYFYKAKFSKDPVDKLPESTTSTTTSKNTTTDYSGLSSLFGSSGNNGDDWDDAKNDDDIKEGDKVEVTAISTEDSYYDDRDDYIGKQGIVGDDLEYDDSEDGYGCTLKMNNGTTAYFYLVKLKKISGSSSSTKSSTSSSSSSKTIAKGTRVLVTDLDKDDSFYSSKDKYVRKRGKVADGLNQQEGDYYSGKIIFDDGTDAYFFKVKVTILN